MRFRLITYNIHKGIGGVDRRYRLERIIDVLGRYEADLLLLQEVDHGVPRSGKHCQVDILGDALGLAHRVFQPNVRLREGVYGNAILSRFPLSDCHQVDLTVRWKKRRGALIARCRLPVDGLSRRLLVVNVHLGLAGIERAVQLRRLLTDEMLQRTHHETPLILAGDFNDVYGNLGKRWLEPAGFRPAGRKVRTFPAVLPLRPLDRIFLRGRLQTARCFASRTSLARQASDHLPLIAEMQLTADHR